MRGGSEGQGGCASRKEGQIQALKMAIVLYSSSHRAKT
jgi:hypothetical protein